MMPPYFRRRRRPEAMPPPQDAPKPVTVSVPEPAVCGGTIEEAAGLPREPYRTDAERLDSLYPRSPFASLGGPPGPSARAEADRERVEARAWALRVAQDASGSGGEETTEVPAQPPGQPETPPDGVLGYVIVLRGESRAGLADTDLKSLETARHEAGQHGKRPGWAGRVIVCEVREIR